MDVVYLEATRDDYGHVGFFVEVHKSYVCGDASC